ncbi:rab GTPase-activating protein 1-like, partial [Pollicipes pollicipes]|uniref:rab GTPase-activating protein 1-like n=1 Tax=Pollicipes pollicipes TaxID=41117 RepID=UPI001884A8BF
MAVLNPAGMQMKAGHAPVVVAGPGAADAGNDHAMFHRVFYLGAASINAPRSEPEIQRNMAILNAEEAGRQAIPVCVAVPTTPQGCVVVYEEETETVMTSFPVYRILFCARRPSSSCHVFKCAAARASGRVLGCFARAFRKQSAEGAAEDGVDVAPRTCRYDFELSVEMQEEDAKGVYAAIPRDKGGFKLRCNTQRKVLVSVRQTSDLLPPLTVERCFGLLVAPGKNVKHGDMTLLEMPSMGSVVGDRHCYSVVGLWDAGDPNLTLLNQETPKDLPLVMSIGRRPGH